MQRLLVSVRVPIEAVEAAKGGAHIADVEYPASTVSAGLVPFAIGTETWGSIVSPSTVCSITGLRPTYGRVSRTGAMALSWSMDKIGPTDLQKY